MPGLRSRDPSCGCQPPGRAAPASLKFVSRRGSSPRPGFCAHPGLAPQPSVGPRLRVHAICADRSRQRLSGTVSSHLESGVLTLSKHKLTQIVGFSLPRLVLSHKGAMIITLISVDSCMISTRSMQGSRTEDAFEGFRWPVGHRMQSV